MSWRASEFWWKVEIERQGNQRGPTAWGQRIHRSRARNSPQQDSWAIARQHDHEAFPDSGWRAYQSSCLLLSPERSAVGSWRKAGDPGPAGVKAVAALSSGQKSALAVPLSSVGPPWLGMPLSRPFRGPSCWLFAQKQWEVHPPAWWEGRTDMRLPFSPRRPIIHWVTDALFSERSGSWTGLLAHPPLLRPLSAAWAQVGAAQPAHPA